MTWKGKSQWLSEALGFQYQLPSYSGAAAPPLSWRLLFFQLQLIFVAINYVMWKEKVLFYTNDKFN